MAFNYMCAARFHSFAERVSAARGFICLLDWRAGLQFLALCIFTVRIGWTADGLE